MSHNRAKSGGEQISHENSGVLLIRFVHYMNPFFIFETSVYIIQDIYIIYQKNVDVHIKRYFVNIYIYLSKKPYSAYLTNETWESLVNLAVKKKTHP